MIFCKYEFPDNIWNDLKRTIQSSGQYVDCSVVELGNLCVEKDDNGNCILFQEGFSVDIMWYKDIPSSFNEYEVFPKPSGVHTFFGCENLYEERFNQFNGS